MSQTVNRAPKVALSGNEVTARGVAPAGKSGMFPVVDSSTLNEEQRCLLLSILSVVLMDGPDWCALRRDALRLLSEDNHMGELAPFIIRFLTEALGHSCGMCFWKAQEYMRTNCIRGDRQEVEGSVRGSAHASTDQVAAAALADKRVRDGPFVSLTVESPNDPVLLLCATNMDRVPRDGEHVGTGQSPRAADHAPKAIIDGGVVGSRCMENATS